MNSAKKQHLGRPSLGILTGTLRQNQRISLDFLYPILRSFSR